MEYTIQNGFMALAADTHGAQLCDLHSLRHPERHLLWTGQADIWPWHAPVCFPWCGKLKGGLFQDRGIQYPAPQHGFVREQEHRLVCQGEDFLEFCLDWRGEETQWPWSFSFRTRFSLSADGVSVIFSVTNLDSRPMPAQLGYHPGLCCPFSDGLGPEDYLIRFERGLEARLQSIPIQRDMFQSRRIVYPNLRSHWVQLEERATGRYLRVDTRDSRCLVLWSKPGIPGFICIEPWSSPPAAGGELIEDPAFQLISPGDTVVYAHGLREGAVLNSRGGAARFAVQAQGN